LIVKVEWADKLRDAMAILASGTKGRFRLRIDDRIRPPI
jgi:hypothetical protein